MGERHLTRLLTVILLLLSIAPAVALGTHHGSASLGGGGLPQSLTLTGAHVFDSNTLNYTVGTVAIPAAGGNFTGTITASNTGVCAGLGADNSSFQVVTTGTSVPVYTLETLGAPGPSPSSNSYHVCYIAAQGATSVSNNFTITGFQTAGLSAWLYTHPYYACNTNYYIATAAGGGSDSHNGTSPSTPWLTRQHADNIIAGLGAGAGAAACVNVAPGTYSDTAILAAGGSQATSTGYLAWRCETLGGCILTADNSFFFSGTHLTSKYVIIDGFHLIASAATVFGVGINMFGGVTAPYPQTTNHIWIVNNEVEGFGESGIQFSEGDYLNAVHNLVHGNATAGCSAQGSGISNATAIATSGYSATSDDLANPMVGAIGPGFHNAVMYNRMYNNATTLCGSAGSPYDTDGNDIIIDESGGLFGLPGWIPYNGGFLVAMNVLYNAGGKGAHGFASAGVTFANNSCYNSDLDPYNTTTGRPCVGMTLGSGVYPNQMFNNISVGIPAAHSFCDFNAATPYAKWNTGGYSNSNLLETTTLSSTIGAGNTSLTVASNVGFPSFGSFVIVVGAGTASSEEMQVTAGAGTTTYTVTRGYAGTTAASHASGAEVDWVQTDIQNNITEIVGGNSSCVAFYFGGTGDYYTLPTTTGGNYVGDQWPLTANETATDPIWNHVGDVSTGTETTQPVGIDFSLAPSSPAINYYYKINGALPSWLPWWAVDAGAIPHQLPSWP
jgi:hypothetical protein